MSKTNLHLEKDKIDCPNVLIGQQAQWQLSLMLGHDARLENKGLRISIDGKGCDGFTYAIGFDAIDKDDFVVQAEISDHENEIRHTRVIFDPFAAFYLQNVNIDFKFDPETEEDGFLVSNKDQKEFHGKFWRKTDDKTPPEIIS